MVRRSRSEIVDFSSDDDEKIISYCKSCLKYGFSVPLKNRIYQNEPIPPDHENWLQCHDCGLIVPVYEVEKESSIKDVVETVDNPFDTGKMILGIDNRTSVGGRNTRKKKERQKELENIKETDLKADLAKGNTLMSYTEYQPQ